MFVLGNLLLFCSEVILLDCVVPHMLQGMIMFDTCEYHIYHIGYDFYIVCIKYLIKF
jgi:hypothetical protein